MQERAEGTVLHDEHAHREPEACTSGRTGNKLLPELNAHDLLIIDDFGMVKLDGQIQHDFEQIIDDRYNRKALILASQLPVADWYDVFQSELIAEACLDRIVHKAIKFDLKGESLRKKY